MSNYYQLKAIVDLLKVCNEHLDEASNQFRDLRAYVSQLETPQEGWTKGEKDLVTQSVSFFNAVIAYILLQYSVVIRKLEKAEVLDEKPIDEFIKDLKIATKFIDEKSIANFKQSTGNKGAKE